MNTLKIYPFYFINEHLKAFVIGPFKKKLIFLISQKNCIKTFKQ